MLLPVVIFIFSAVIGIAVGLKFLRYGSSREVILDLFCYLQGRKPVWIRDPVMAQRVLQSSSAKGSGIEQLISYQAFLPVLSLESVDGEEWIRMKRNFMLFRAQLPPLVALSKISSSVCQEYLDKEEVIDSPRLVQIIFYTMLKWIFDIDKSAADPTSMEVVLDAIFEWRKELAIKTKADMALKLKAVDWIKKLIRSSKYEELFGDKWEEPEYWSIVLQPFFISPIINITDVAVTVNSDPFRREYLKQNPWSEQLLVNAINLNHPFPVLERWFPDGLIEPDTNTSKPQFIISPNTHIFMPMDNIGRELCHTSNQNQGASHSSAWAAFGAGKRACAGRDIAFTLSSHLFQQLMTSDKFKPIENHFFSGRDNDSKETFSESLFQLSLLLKITWRLLRKRLTSWSPLSYSRLTSKNQNCTNSSLLL